MACSGGGLTALLLKRLLPRFGGKKWSLLVCLNGSLAGIVSIIITANLIPPSYPDIISDISPYYFCQSILFEHQLLYNNYDLAIIH